jgi:hypothetical protein
VTELDATPSDLDLMGVLSPIVPQGPALAADPSLTTIAPVYAVDAGARLVQVGVHGSPMWLRANPGRYRLRDPGGISGVARVLLNPTTGRPDQVLAPVDPRDPVVSALLTAINTTTKVATVSVDGVSHVIPYVASTYTVGTPVWVGLSDWGVPQLVYGSSDTAAAPTVTPPAPPTSAATVQVVDQPVGAQWSGTYRHNRSAWDRWNGGSYGGYSTLYQGDGFGSGPLTGLATYGDQLVNLGAISIEKIEVTLRSVGLSGASGPAVVQGSPHASQPAGAPTSSGDTAAGDGAAALTATMREAMRTGAVRGLALVGGNYWAVAGAGNGSGMTLLVTYTRPA